MSPSAWWCRDVIADHILQSPIDTWWGAISQHAQGKSTRRLPSTMEVFRYLFCSFWYCVNSEIELRISVSTQKIHVNKAHVHEANDDTNQTNVKRKTNEGKAQRHPTIRCVNIFGLFSTLLQSMRNSRVVVLLFPCQPFSWRKKNKKKHNCTQMKPL